MNIIRVNEETINYGKRMFGRRIAVMVGSIDPSSYWEDEDFCGRRALFGVILACIEYGLSAPNEIISVAARITRCKKRTVCRVLDELTGENPAIHLWCFENDSYRDLRSALGITGHPQLLLAA